MHFYRILAACALACAAAIPAAAQERAWFVAGNSLTEVAITAGGRDWTPVSSVALPPHSPVSPIVWGGGRYILWFASRTDGHWFVRFDTRSRQLAAFPLSSAPSAMAIDRLTTRLVVLDSSALYLVDAEHLSIVGQVAVPSAQPAELRSLAVAHGHIFLGRRTDDGSVREVAVLDAGSLAHIRTIPGVWDAQASRDERRVYLQSRWPVEVQVWDAGTLTLIHTGTANYFVHAVGDAIASEYRIPGMFSTAVRVCEYDRDSLNVMRQADVDVYSRAVSGSFVLELQQASPRSPIVLRSHSSDYGVVSRTIQVYDPLTLAPIREMRQATFDPLASTLLMLAPPDQPTGLHAVVNGATALLTWIPAPDVGEYEVVAGTAPGLSNIGTFRTSGVPLALFHGVPRGTYYVRVRAINELGSSVSVERTILVP